MAIRLRETRGVKTGGRQARSMGNQLASNKRKKRDRDSTPMGAGPVSVFGARDNIKYRKYQNNMALKNKSQPLSKEQWLKSGRPD